MVSATGVTVSYAPTTQLPLSQLAVKNGWAVSTDPNGGSSSAGDAAQAEFSRVAKKTPAEQMRGAMLNKLGFAEDQLGSMSPEQRKAVEDKLKDMVKQMAEADPAKGAQTGLIADIKA
jgi:hypothetical protein